MPPPDAAGTPLGSAEGGLYAALAVITLASAIALSLHVPGSIWVGSIARKNAVVALMAISVLAYFALCWLILRQEHQQQGWPRRALLLMFAASAALRLMMLAAPPFMSSDIYRYVWDGRVQQAGINPYVYVPADPALSFLRDPDVYPRINRAGYAHTIYPPAAQLLYRVSAAILPGVAGMKALMLLLEAGGVAALLALLARAGLPRMRAALYLCNPLAIWAVALDGHIDGAAIGFLGLCLLAAASNRRALSGALLAGAILTKFLPLLAAPAIWRRGDWRAPAACLAVIAGPYALYSDAGARVLGFLPNYTQEENLVQGSGFWPLSLIPPALLPGWASLGWVLAWAAALALLAAWLVFRAPPAPSAEQHLARAAVLLLGGALLALTPHYAWYFPILALPGAIWPRAGFLYLSAAPVLLYSDPWHDEVLIQTAVFLPAVILLAHDAWRGGARAHRPAQGVANA